MKKWSVGAWLTCLAAVITIAGFIAYLSNINGEGYYQGAVVSNLPLAVWGAAACLLVALLLNLGKGNKGIDLVSGVLRIAAPALLAWGLMSLVAGRVDGLGYIYFSNADVAKEVQTAANLGSAQTTIWNMGFLGVAMVLSIIAAFFSLRKKSAK